MVITFTQPAAFSKATEIVHKDSYLDKFGINSFYTSKASRFACVSWLADGSNIIAGTIDGSLVCIPPDLRATAWAQESSVGSVHAVAANPERPAVFVAAIKDQHDPHIRYCDTRSRSMSRSDAKKCSMRTGDLLAVSWHPDGVRLLLSQTNGQVQLHDIRKLGRGGSKPSDVLASRKVTWECNALLFTGGGKGILAAYGDGGGGGVRMLSGDNLRDVAQWPAHTAPCISISRSCTASHDLLAVGCNDATVSLWDTRSMTVMRVVTISDVATRHVSWSPDGRYLAFDSSIGTADRHHAVDVAVVDRQEGILGPIRYHRVEALAAGRSLYLDGLAWGPRRNQLAIIGDDMHTKGREETRSGMWCLSPPS